jgi:hypothetical protein
MEVEMPMMLSRRVNNVALMDGDMIVKVDVDDFTCFTS